MVPGVKIEREFADGGPYWEKLSTQIAGGNGPDIIHMHQNMVNEYANRGALLPLDPLVEAKKIDLSDFPKGTIDSGKRGGINWMIALGATAPSVVYNAPALEKTGLPAPTNALTWNDYAALLTEAQKTLAEGTYAGNDSGAYEDAIQVYMRQRGFELFKGDKLQEVGFSKEALADWWSQWETLRKNKVIPPAALVQEYATASHADSMLAKGMVLATIISANQLQIFQQYMDDELNCVVTPRGNEPGSPPGDYIGTAWLSIYSKTKFVDESAAFCSWFVNDPDAAKIFMAEHGPPGSTKIFEMLKPLVPKPVQKGFDLISYIAPHIVPAGERPTQGNDVMKAMHRIYGEVSFGNISVEEGVDRFFEEAATLLSS
ncbi:MAG: ABC transporter substrate-binding protein [Anaerolineae bacterium]